MIAPKSNRAAKSGLQTSLVVIVEDVAVSGFVWRARVIDIKHRVCQPAGVPHHRHRAVSHGDHLSETARLIDAGHQHQVRTGVYQMSEFFVITELEMAIGMVVQEPLQMLESMAEVR